MSVHATEQRPFRFSLLNLPIDALDARQMNDRLDQAIRARRQLFIAHHNMHSLALARTDREFRAIVSGADLVHLDSKILLLAAQMKGVPVLERHRLAYLDWMPEFWSRAAKSRWRVLVVAGRPGVSEQAADVLRSKYEGLQIHAIDGYMQSRESEVLEYIRKQQPDVVLVGMGMPLQEKWTHRVRVQLPECPILCCGGYFDYVAGEQVLTPRFFASIGCEWLFRLIMNPRRLAGRYLIEPWPVLVRLLVEILTTRWRRQEAA